VDEPAFGITLGNSFGGLLDGSLEGEDGAGCQLAQGVLVVITKRGNLVIEAVIAGRGNLVAGSRTAPLPPGVERRVRPVLVGVLRKLRSGPAEVFRGPRRPVVG
jgi:hypothetical protein